MQTPEPSAARIEELEARAAALVEYGNSLPDGVTTEAFAEASNLRREARELRAAEGVVAHKQLVREQGRPPNNFLRSTYYALGSIAGVCFASFFGWGVALGWLVGGVLVPWAIFAYACRKDLHV